MVATRWARSTCSVGPAGLLLATPLTVCVVVIGRHVPNLTFLQVVLSVEPVLAPRTRFYQPMLGLDLDEANQVCEDFLKTRPLEDLYDEVIIPALSLAEEDRHRGKLDEAKEQFLFQSTRSLLEDMSERAEELAQTGKSAPLAKPAGEEKIRLEPVGPAEVVCLAARDDADELAALMLKQLIQRAGVSARAINAGLSPSL